MNPSEPTGTPAPDTDGPAYLSTFDAAEPGQMVPVEVDGCELQNLRAVETHAYWDCDNSDFSSYPQMDLATGEIDWITPEGFPEGAQFRARSITRVGPVFALLATIPDDGLTKGRSLEQVVQLDWDGTLVWTHDRAHGFYVASPTDPSLVYAANGDSLSAFDVATGDQRWAVTLPTQLSSNVRTVVAVTGGRDRFAAERNLRYVVVDPATGAVTDEQEDSYADPVDAGVTPPAGYAVKTAVTEGGSHWVLDDGDQLWSFDVRLAEAWFDGDTMYAHPRVTSTSSPRLLVLDARTGEQQGEHPMPLECKYIAAVVTTASGSTGLLCQYAEGEGDSYLGAHLLKVS